MFFAGFGRNMRSWVLTGKCIISVLAEKCVFAVLAEMCGFTGLTEKCVFYGNMRFTFFEEKHILRFWRESVFFSFCGKMYLQKNKIYGLKIIF